MIAMTSVRDHKDFKVIKIDNEDDERNE